MAAFISLQKGSIYFSNRKPYPVNLQVQSETGDLLFEKCLESGDTQKKRFAIDSNVVIKLWSEEVVLFKRVSVSDV